MEKLNRLIIDHLDTDRNIICKIKDTIYYSTDWGWAKEPMGYAHNVANDKATVKIIEDYLHDTPSVFLKSVPTCSLPA